MIILNFMFFLLAIFMTKQIYKNLYKFAKNLPIGKLQDKKISLFPKARTARQDSFFRKSRKVWKSPKQSTR